MEEIVTNRKEDISSMIYELKGVQVMLDSDLALLYKVGTKRINEAVNRNKEKFPDRFSWILNKKEEDILWSQNATANLSSKSRVLHRVFNEQGVAMLASVLQSVAPLTNKHKYGRLTNGYGSGFNEKIFTSY